MSEIICSYTINQQAEESFFVTDTRVSFSQFTQFIHDNIFAEDFTIKDASNNEIIQNDDHLKALFHTAIQSGILSINIASLEKKEEINAPELVSQERQTEVKVEEQEQEQEQSTNTFIGPITQSILNRFGIEVERDISPSEIIKNLPFPLSMIVQSKLDLVIREPDALENIVLGIASCLNIPFEELYAEVTETLAAMKEPKEEAPIAAEESCSQDSKSEKEEVKHAAICDRCQEWIVGIRYKCLHCPDYDLCVTCEELQAQNSFHEDDHVFAKLYRPYPHPLVSPAHFRARRPMHPLGHFMAQRGCPVRCPSPMENSNQKNHPKAKPHQRLQALEESVKQLQQQIQQLVSPQNKNSTG